MTWTWRCEHIDGTELEQVEANTEIFPSRGDAETWLGEHWADLAEAGAQQVTLLQDDAPLYTMSLAEDI